MIVSLVGKIEMYDGQSINIKCADGVIAKVVCEADEIQQGSIYELVGLAKDDGTLQVRTCAVWNEHRAEVHETAAILTFFAFHTASYLRHGNFPWTWTWSFTTE